MTRYPQRPADFPNASAQADFCYQQALDWPAGGMRKRTKGGCRIPFRQLNRDAAGGFDRAFKFY